MPPLPPCRAVCCSSKPSGGAQQHSISWYVQGHQGQTANSWTVTLNLVVVMMMVGQTAAAAVQGLTVGMTAGHHPGGNVQAGTEAGVCPNPEERLHRAALACCQHHVPLTQKHHKQHNRLLLDQEGLQKPMLSPQHAAHPHTWCGAS